VLAGNFLNAYDLSKPSCSLAERRNSMPHRLKRAVAATERQGWRLARITGNQHFLFESPSGARLLLNLHGRFVQDRYLARHLRPTARLAKAR
jgi:hypothetical protein